MGRMRSVGALLGLAAVYFAGLRLLHLAVPAFYPDVLQGPFVVEKIEEAERFSDFSPLAPFYRPERLGRRPVSVTVTRPPRPRVVVYWQGDKFLVLAQEQNAHPQAPPPDARRFPGHSDVLWWREGATHYLRFRRGDLTVELRTDLPESEIARVLDTLRPVKDLL